MEPGSVTTRLAEDGAVGGVVEALEAAANGEAGYAEDAVGLCAQPPLSLAEAVGRRAGASLENSALASPESNPPDAEFVALELKAGTPIVAGLVV